LSVKLMLRLHKQVDSQDGTKSLYKSIFVLSRLRNSLYEEVSKPT